MPGDIIKELILYSVAVDKDYSQIIKESLEPYIPIEVDKNLRISRTIVYKLMRTRIFRM